MNKQYLKDNGLYNAHKQFMKLCEWGYAPTALEEDDEEQQDPNAMGNDPMAGGADPNAMGQNPMANGGQDPNAMGSDPNMMGADPNAMAGGNDPNVMGADDPNAMGGDPNMMGDVPPMDVPMDDEPQETDDVIDVEDLTQAQEKTNDKVNHVGKDVANVDSRIEKMLQSIEKMQHMIDKNNNDIQDLNNELKKRVATPTEKLNMRSLDSYPFNVKPTEYWDTKKGDPNYSIAMNNDTAPQEEYQIKQSDIDNLNDKEIEDSFNNIIDDQFRQDINKIFGI